MSFFNLKPCIISSWAAKLPLLADFAPKWLFFCDKNFGIPTLDTHSLYNMALRYSPQCLHGRQWLKPLNPSVFFFCCKFYNLRTRIFKIDVTCDKRW